MPSARLNIVFTCAACHRTRPTHAGLSVTNWTCAECQAKGKEASLGTLEAAIRAAHTGEKPWTEQT